MMINNFFTNIKKFYKDNFFTCTALLFGLWICFFDSNSLISQSKTRKKISVLKKEKNFYINQINILKKDFNKINNNEEQIKRLAKEKYFLREEGEEIYLLEKK